MARAGGWAGSRRWASGRAGERASGGRPRRGDKNVRGEPRAGNEDAADFRRAGEDRSSRGEEWRERRTVPSSEQTCEPSRLGTSRGLSVGGEILACGVRGLMPGDGGGHYPHSHSFVLPLVATARAAQAGVL